MDVSDEGKVPEEAVPGRILPETNQGRAAPGFKVELLPGAIVRFRVANYAAEDSGMYAVQMVKRAYKHRVTLASSV